MSQPTRPRLRTRPIRTGPTRTGPTQTGATRRPAGPTAGHTTQHGPVVFGFLFALGALAAYWLGGLLLSVGSILVLVVVAMFLAAGLHPLVLFFQRRLKMPRQAAVVTVIALVLAAVAAFVFTLTPIISEQVSALVANVPHWAETLQENDRIRDLEERFGVMDRIESALASGGVASNVFGGVLGVGMAVLSALVNAGIVIVLTLYFLASLDTTKDAIYQLAPASRRDRVSYLGDRILSSIGGYVAGAFVVALCAGLSSLVFLLVVGLGKYAIALSLVVALLDIIPMIGATIGAAVVTTIGFATDPKIGLACLIFYLVYQQVENYGVYPRVMKRSVDVPGAVTVIAALIGAALLGVIGAMLAVPTAAAILLLVREVWLPKQETC